MTRQQRFLTRALADVNGVKTTVPGEVGKIYGGLCHAFPVLVRTGGLCQAVAFVQAKAEGTDARAQAYKLLRGHAAGLLGVGDERLLDTIRDADMVKYMRQTRMILAAWIYYKRFAVSILKVESAQAAQDEEGA